MTEEVVGEPSTNYPLVEVLRTSGWANLPYLVVAMISTAVTSFLDRADVFILGLAFDAMFNERTYSLPLIPDGWIPTEPLQQLWFTVVLLLVMKILDVLFANVSELTRSIFSQRTIHDLRVAAFEDAQRLELGFFDRSLTGDVMSVLNNDVNTLEGFLDWRFSFSVWIIVSISTAVGLMVVLNWQLALFVLGAAPVIAAVNWWFADTLEDLEDAVRSAVGRLNARLQTNLGGIAVIKAFTAERYEVDRVAAASSDHYEAQWDSDRILARHGPAIRLIAGASLLVTFAVGSSWVVYGPPIFFSGRLTAGELIPFLFYMQQLTGPMQGISAVIADYKRSKAAAKRVVGLREHDRTIDCDGDDLDEVAGHVEYAGVRFAYPETTERVVDDVSFAVSPGETIGIVGATGAGKSTLVKLLLRFYDVDEGSIAVDGRDVRSVSCSDLRDAIGYVNQDPFLFDGTVQENISYGAPEADQSAVARVAREAGAHGFIQRLPQGYDTAVGQRGVTLSGGQRQRIAIARAVLGDPPIMVFDEATSHVDNETELLIQRNLERLTADRTTIVIAHRLSTVRNAGRILVMDDGRLIEEGTHEELLATDGTYADLWRVQTGEIDAHSPSE